MRFIQQKLENVQFDHSLWMNELNFAFEEIPIYMKRIQELLKYVSDSEDHELLANLLNGFMVQKEMVFQLQDQIRNHIIKMSSKIHSNGSLNTLINSDHSETRKKMETFRSSYSLLKETYHRFAAHKTED